jgi:mono/diheme cytochrome c family protein
MNRIANALLKCVGRKVAYLALLLGPVACASGAQSPKAALNADPGGLLFNGYAKPDVACFGCHNGDAKGAGRGPSLAERVPKLTDAQIVHAIDSGPWMMPAYKEKLNDAEKKQLVTWLRARFREGTQ